jgi:hypothetical protein
MAKTKGRGLRRILVQIHGFGRYNFARIVMPARGADVMRALQLAAVIAFLGVACDQCIMRAAHVPFGRGDSVLRDSHVWAF